MAVLRLGAGRWTPVVIAVAAFVLVVGGGILLTKGGGDAKSSDDTDPAAGSISLVSGDTTTTVVVDTTPQTTVAVDNSVVKVPLTRTISNGQSGDDVKAVQQRLKDLTFDPGPVDGVYGSYTVQAVWAFETLVLQTPLADVTGKVTPEMWDRMQDAVTVAPRRTNLTSTHVEIYLPEQALVLFKDNVPALIAHISSGELADPGTDFTKGATWCSEVTISPGEIGNEDGTEPIKDGRCGNAETPGGTYRFYREVVGRRESALGGMYDPVYFNYGIAVHGAENVPDHPASHGCIRINKYLGPIFQSMITKLGKNSGDQVYVWNGVKEPEDYGAKPGWFDTPDLEWRAAHPTSTSSSSTSSTSSTTTLPGATTTVAPATTPAATTAAPPAATTTTTTTTTVAPTTPPTAAPTTPATAPPGP
jgi:hypothetical protein